VPSVVVTPMTNLGFHELMSQHGIETHVTDEVGDRYVLETIRATGGKLGGEQSGHIIYLDGHVTGDGLVAALLLCRALEGRHARRGGGRHAAPSPGEGERARALEDASSELLDEVARHNEELAGRGRVLVGPPERSRWFASWRRPGREEAASLCARIASLVRRELG
jgi:phosphoglucosamine mutase